MKKRGMPTALFLVAFGLLLFFIYALVSVGVDFHLMVASNRSNAALFADSVMRFVSDNKYVFAGAAAVLIIIKIFSKPPRTVRSS
jgi:uncharacterized membrane protein (UPF0136 family)